MNGMFHGAKNMENFATDFPNISLVRNLDETFLGCEKFNADLNNWDTMNVESAHGFLSGAKAFNGKMDKWNTTNIVDLSFFFAGAENFNSDISAWDVSSVKNMTSTFEGAKKFNQNIGNWDTNNLGSLANTFKNATSFNQNIENWNTRNVMSMEGAFDGATSFASPLGKWNIDNVMTFEKFLQNTTSYKTSFFSDNWDFSNVQNMKNAFTGVGFSSDIYKNFLKYIIKFQLQKNVELSYFSPLPCGNFPERQAVESGFNWKISDASDACNTNATITTPIIGKIFNASTLPKVLSGTTQPSLEFQIIDSTGKILASGSADKD